MKWGLSAMQWGIKSSAPCFSGRRVKKSALNSSLFFHHFSSHSSEHKTIKAEKLQWNVFFCFGDRGWITSLAWVLEGKQKIIISRRIKMFMTMQMKVMVVLFGDSFGIIINISFGSYTRPRILSSLWESEKSSINLTSCNVFMSLRVCEVIVRNQMIYFLIVCDKC